MPEILSACLRVTVDGKFFRLGANKFYVKGVTYGPFAPDREGRFFPPPAQAKRDLAQIRDLGANLVRIYALPAAWFFELAAEHDLKILLDVPWSKHLCFLDDAKAREEAEQAVRQAAETYAGHPALFALSVVNEIPPDIVRWSGTRRVAEFIDRLCALVKEVDPQCLCTFANYPPTEFLRAQANDFVTFNVYLHHQKPYQNYLSRLQILADSKPLMIGEFGIDSSEGETRKAAILEWQIETTFRAGLAGSVIYSFTDDWYRGGMQITNWAFGLTTRERQPKDSFQAVHKSFQQAPYFPLASWPMVSIVVASFNGARTLKACLDSLFRLHYPNYEVILLDDGSTDETPQIAALYPGLIYLRQENLGLSSARNAGIEKARGEIVAFTDSDCRADEDWLYYLAGDLQSGNFAGIGGPNFLPPEDSWIAGAVMVSPGGPAHVMLTDRLAEHIPGCNMAFYKSALDEVGRFDPIFRKAGDDVDLCWRLQQAGYQIGFSPSGFVWHYRRSTLRAYLTQQKGYGAAEALLVHKHPEYFNLLGGSIWRGRIYTAARFGVTIRPPMIYHGMFGSSLFQSLYISAPAGAVMFFTSLEYHVLVTIPLLILSVVFHFLAPLAIASLACPVALCIAAAAQADLPRKSRRFWSRPLVALLFFLQPIVRGWARYQGRLTLRPTPLEAYESLDSLALKKFRGSFEKADYWAQNGVSRLDFLRRTLDLLDRRGWQNKSDIGWSNFDIEIFGSRWTRLYLTTAAEDHGQGRQLIRCRLRAAWTLLSQIVFFGLLGAELLLLSFLGQQRYWIWSLFLALPLFVWRLKKNQRDMQRLMIVFLDQVAKELELARVV